MYGELPEIQTKNGQSIRAFPVHIPYPEKVAALRLPTTDEMMDYLRKQKTQYRYLGRGKGESIPVPNPKLDQELFERLRVDSGSESHDFDPDECSHALNLLTQQRITSCDRKGDEFIITLRTMFGDTVHILHPPFMKDMAEYRRGVYKPIDLPNNLEERRYPPEAPCKLYDSCVVSSSGYASGFEVPPHHKQAVVLQLVTAVSELDPSLDPNV